jgi:protein tyrosine phosphatase (PTP) superfamily phosphohydrolase (DUF442 family)
MNSGTPKDKGMSRQSTTYKKLTKAGYLCVLVGVAVIFAYLVYAYGPRSYTLLTNRDAGGNAEVSGKKNWAERVELAGVPNLHKVSDDAYRGAQPTAEGMQQLEKLGVRTIINLRSFHSDRDEIGETGLGYEHIYMKTWHPEDEEVARFLKIVTDPNRTPVFVHCRRGADRTGTMCAVYRIAVQGWSKDEAIEEMTKGGFGFYSGWRNLVEYIRSLDVDEMKARAGLKD